MRVSMIGWAAPTGLGSLNRDLASCDWIHRWLAPNHPRLGIDVPPAPPRKAETSASPWPVHESLFNWLIDGADVLLFAEIPYVHEYLLKKAKAQGVKLVCIPMTDQLRWNAEWIDLVDLFYCPTKFAVEALESVKRKRSSSFKIAGGSWGVDLDRFKFKPRNRCNRFLFVNGWGGVSHRKGLRCLLSAAHLLPKKSVALVSQRPLDPLPEAFEVYPGLDDNAAIYDLGDVLLAPSRFEGLGLQYYEAQSSGLPVVVTDAPPMHECNPFRLIRADKRDLRNGCNDVYDPCSESLAKIVNELYGADIELASYRARGHVDLFHDVRTVMESLRQSLSELVG